MKKVLISIFTTLSVIVGIYVVFLFSQHTTASQTPSNDEFLSIITHKFPSFLREGEPVIKINSISQYDNKWFIISISSVKDIKNQVPVKILFIRLDNRDASLRVIAGPDTYFSEAELIKYNVPDSVIIELQKS